jgi:hypothetical protein
MLQDCDARSDAEDKLCKCSGPVVAMQRSVVMPLASVPGCDEQWVMSLPGVSVGIWTRAFGVGILFLEELPPVAKTLPGVVDDVPSVGVSPIVCEEDV